MTLVTPSQQKAMTDQIAVMGMRTVSGPKRSERRGMRARKGRPQPLMMITRIEAVE